MKKKWMQLSALGISMLLMTSWGCIVGNIERPKYQITSAHDQIEIRQYRPMIVAEVTVQGDREDAIRRGFRLLADYIFGNNTADSKIAMTAPVTQQPGRKIAMTAPVTQRMAGKDWTVHFVMPSEYTLDTLPKPNNQAVTIKQIPAKKFAVIRFSGMHTNENIATHERELRAYLSQTKVTILSAPAYAFYNPPWTLSFLRRNEVMVEIAEGNE